MSVNEFLPLYGFFLAILSLLFYRIHREQVTSDYNPPINFCPRSLDETHHVVQNRTAGIDSDFDFGSISAYGGKKPLQTLNLQKPRGENANQ